MSSPKLVDGLALFPPGQELNEEMLKAIGVGPRKVQALIKKLPHNEVETWGELLGLKDLEKAVQAAGDAYGETLWYLVQEYKRLSAALAAKNAASVPASAGKHSRNSLDMVAAAAAAASQGTPRHGRKSNANDSSDDEDDDGEGGSAKKLKRTRNRPACLECTVRSHDKDSTCGLNWWIKNEKLLVERNGGELRKDACRRLWPANKAAILAKMAEAKAAEAKAGTDAAAT